MRIQRLQNMCSALEPPAPLEDYQSHSLKFRLQRMQGLRDFEGRQLTLTPSIDQKQSSSNAVSATTRGGAHTCTPARCPRNEDTSRTVITGSAVTMLHIQSANNLNSFWNQESVSERNQLEYGRLVGLV
eukprot:scaffold421349_cov70-Attheya_sp.AAC.1